MNTLDDLIAMVKSKEDPYGYIASFFPAIYWLDLVYTEMYFRNEIPALRDLPMKTKLFYWNHVFGVDKNKKWLRICACRAMTAYDIVK